MTVVAAVNPKFFIGEKVLFVEENYCEQPGWIEKITPVVIDGKRTFSYAVSQVDAEYIDDEPFYDIRYHVYEYEIVKYYPEPVEGDPEWLFYSEGMDFEYSNPMGVLKNCKLLKRKPKTKMKDFSVYYD